MEGRKGRRHTDNGQRPGELGKRGEMLNHVVLKIRPERVLGRGERWSEKASPSL